MLALMLFAFTACNNNPSGAILPPPFVSRPEVFTVSDFSSLSAALAKADDGDSIILDDVPVTTDADLPLTVSSDVTIRGKISFAEEAASSSSAAYSAPLQSRAGGNIVVFDVFDTAAVTFSSFEAEIPADLASLFKSVVSVDTGRVIASDVAVSVVSLDEEKTAAVPFIELGEHATAGSVSGDLSSVVVSVDENNENAYEVIKEVASSSGATPSIGAETFIVYNVTKQTGYDGLPEAVEAAADGDTIDLLKSAEGSGIVFEESKFNADGLTIDLNGNTYTVIGPTVGSTGTETNGLQLLKGNKVTFIDGTVTATTPDVEILFQNYCGLTLDNVRVIAGPATDYVISNNNQSLTLRNNTAIVAKEGGIAFDVCCASYYPDGVTVKIEDPSVVIDGPVEYGLWGYNSETVTLEILQKTAFIVPAGYENSIDLKNGIGSYELEWIDAAEDGYRTISFKKVSE